MMKEGEWQFARTICEDGSDPVGANCYSPLFFAKFPSLGRMAIRPYVACRVRCGILTRV